MRIPLVIILLFLGLAACWNPSKEEVPPPTISAVSGFAPVPYRNFYRIAQSIADAEEKQFLAYNKDKHSLDFFAMTEGQINPLKSLQLEAEGPNSIDRLSGFSYLNSDSIFLFSSYQITLLNEDGEIHFQLDTKQLDKGHKSGLDLSVYSVFIQQENGSQAAYRDGFLFLPLNYFGHSANTEIESYSESVALIATYDLEQEQLRPLPIRYPDIFREDMYGFAATPQFYYTTSAVVYSFVGFPEVYVYDLGSQSLRILANKNSFPTTQPMLNRDAIEHLRTASLQYSYGVLSPDERYLYQAVILPRQPGDPQFIYLRTTDLQEGTATITDFPKAHAFTGMFAYKDGLYLPQMSVGEDSIGFSRLVFD